MIRRPMVSVLWDLRNRQSIMVSSCSSGFVLKRASTSLLTSFQSKRDVNGSILRLTERFYGSNSNGQRLYEPRREWLKYFLPPMPAVG